MLGHGVTLGAELVLRVEDVLEHELGDAKQFEEVRIDVGEVLGLNVAESNVHKVLLKSFNIHLSYDLVDVDGCCAMCGQREEEG